MPEKIVVINKLSPGDVIVLSAAIRDISLAYPGKFAFMPKTSTPAVWANNPYISNFAEAGARSIVANYPLIKQSNQNRLHFIWGFLDDLNKKLGVNAPLTELRPDLHISPYEISHPPCAVQKPYWVMVSGGKSDFTAKWWDPAKWQTVVDRLAPARTIVQVGGHTHVHPKLTGVVDLVGKTNMRDLINLIYHAEGVLCIVTCLAHIAAAFNKPCVSVAGGREPFWWEAYTKETRTLSMRRNNPNWMPPADDYIDQCYLHTLNKLPCCMNKGCWATHVGNRPRRCSNQVKVGKLDLPKCMDMITADDVVSAVQSYFKEPLKRTTHPLPALIPPSVHIVGNPTLLPETKFAGRRTLPTMARPPLGTAKVKAAMPRSYVPGSVECYAASPEVAKHWTADSLPITTGSPAERRQKALTTVADWILWASPSAVPSGRQWVQQMKSELTADAVGFIGWKPFKQEYELKIGAAQWYVPNKWEQSVSCKRVHTFIGNAFVVRTKVFKDVFAGLVPDSDEAAAIAVSEYCRRKGLRRRNAGTWLCPV